MVIKKLIEITGRQTQVELIIEETIREPDGLAMSSRNLRLSEEDRNKAPSIIKALTYIKNNLGQQPLKTLKRNAKNNLEDEGFTVDYVEIADAYTLETVNGYSEKLVALVAATINNIRLIDNLVLN
jgi:pantoate--beta-alanine ligase